MKRIIFTTYDDLKIDDYTQNQIKEYHDRLIANKKEYAKSISVEFKYFHNTNDVNDLDFAKANLYKHYLMAELAEEYDEVMYVDLDIVFNTKLNVFEELDLSKGIHVKDQDDQILNKDIQKVLFKSVGKRSHTVKYHITKDLLDGKDNHVMNTGLMIGKSEHIKQIKYYDRMQQAIELIDDIKSNNLETDMSYLRMSYYPNNESIFSYIMEKYNVPYVLMDQAWHHIVNEDEIADESHIIHFVNKKFNTFFKDKTKAIYSIYIEIPDDRLDNPRGPSDDPVNKSKRTKERFTEFTKRLFLNHREYAEFCNAKYICFQRDLQYETFRAQYPLLSEYDVINLYKVHLLQELTEIYDLVLYVDHDVVFNKSIDAFNFLKAESYLCCDTSSGLEVGVYPNARNYFTHYDKDFRNPEAKYWNTHALLQEEDIDGDNEVFNTGIMMASKKVMDQLNYFDDIDGLIDTMAELKEFSMYPPAVQASFGYDNETIMSYRVKTNNVNVDPLDLKWHYKHDYNSLKAYDPATEEFKQQKIRYEQKVKHENIVMTHFISKNFSLFFNK